jgi:hypothetical protein
VRAKGAPHVTQEKRGIFLEPIDFVLTWVDGNDPAWRAERARCLNLPEDPGELACRYRDWDLLKYMFRAYEKYTPWVNKIHFVTWGHLPPWLNVDHPKLHIVNHRDYIPEEYLPTFSSHPIELNAHRISGLADRFVLFNDDMYVLRPTPPERFFKKGLPADFAVLCPHVIKSSGATFAAIVANDVTEINAHFTKSDVLRRNFFKYFNLRYGRALRFTLASLAFPPIVGYWKSHFPQPYLKNTFEKVWEKDFAVLDRTCRNKARSASDVNHWLMRYWQLAEGDFMPSNHRNRIIFNLNEKNVERAVKAIRLQGHDMICLNDHETLDDACVSEIQRKVSAAFEQILPDKSAFEK